MPEPEPRDRVRLKIDTSDPTTEIFLVNDRLSLVDRGVGSLETKQLPGVYKIKLRLARAVEERILLLDHDQAVQVSLQPPSPAPLWGTSRTHEYQVAAAERESSQVHVSLGAGAQVFLFARDWTGQGWRPPLPGAPPANPADGLSLHALDGKLLVDFASAARIGSEGDDAWAACTVALAPGAYLLRSALPRGGATEQTLVAARNWQTQVFFIRASSPAEASTRRLDVTNIAILMARDRFRADRSDMQLADNARLALADERRVLSTKLGDMLRGKFENPMLGLYGAHLMLLERDRARTHDAVDRVNRFVFTETLFDEVVQNLRVLLGSDHPDVEALALSSPLLRAPRPFQAPPMLHRSWLLLLLASNEQPDLVPERTWRSMGPISLLRPFLTWSRPVATQALSPTFLLAQALVERLVTQAERPSLEPLSFQVARERAFSYMESVPIDEERRRQLTLELSVPRGVIENLLARLQRGDSLEAP